MQLHSMHYVTLAGSLYWACVNSWSLVLFMVFLYIYECGQPCTYHTAQVILYSLLQNTQMTCSPTKLSQKD
uniref:Uncharacterized protein n=1 Tax=Arundo donax TaxID=35708 RepID=A0A0A9HJC2_ARUDO